jgi:hypothetical protein
MLYINLSRNETGKNSDIDIMTSSLRNKNVSKTIWGRVAALFWGAVTNNVDTSTKLGGQGFKFFFLYITIIYVRILNLLH